MNEVNIDAELIKKAGGGLVKTFDQMIQLDIDYAARRSLAFDLRILLMTARVIAVQVRALLHRKFRHLRKPTAISPCCEQGK